MWRRLLIFNGLLLFILLSLRYSIELNSVTSVPPTSWTTDVLADCGIVLTGGPGRVREGVDLLYRGSIKKLIIAGVHPKAHWRDILPQWPFYGGLSEDDIVLERRSTTTYGNAVQSLPLVEALHCKSMALVTSTLHMHRAYQTFKSVFPSEFPITKHAIVGGNFHHSLSDEFIETIKSLFYSLWAY